MAGYSYGRGHMARPQGTAEASFCEENPFELELYQDLKPTLN